MHSVSVCSLRLYVSATQRIPHGYVLDALKGVAFLESDFDALFRADGAATMDAFDLNVGDAALCCSAHVALLSALLPLLLNYVLCGGGIGEGARAHKGARAGKCSGGGVAGEWLDAYYLWRWRPSQPERSCWCAWIDAALWRGSELIKLKLCRFGGRRGV